ncbi:MAG TPA: hypothetical protein VFS64_03680 [Solirubrobacterales bacterium]|nr:hypothetical protein [Solirubrobacterales bacterium]
MRGIAVRLLGVTLPAVVVLSLPASAAARDPFASSGPSADAWKRIAPLIREHAAKHTGSFDFQPAFEIERSDGFKVRVAAFGGTIGVIVGRTGPAGGRAVTAYLARGTATSRRLKASFGAYGDLDMRFHPSAEAPRRGRSCHRRKRFGERPGTWTGSFRFVGEGGYISIDAQRAAGEIRRPRPACSHLPAGGHRRRRATASGDPFSSFSLRESFGAGWHHGLESAQVIGLERDEQTLYFALAQQALGRIGVLRLAVASGMGDTFTVNDALTHAEASPPPPFHGTGIYTAAPDGTRSWLGDLTVNFPGAPRFPLAGEQFEAEVERPI